MEISTVICLVLIAAILVGGWLFGKEIDLRKPPAPPEPPELPLSDTARAIIALEDSLKRLQDEYNECSDADVLKEVGKVNDALIQIASRSGTMCKCSGKNV